SLVNRAAAAGYRALCLTVDTPVTGRRERDLRNGMTIPPRISLRSALSVLRSPRWAWQVARKPLRFGNFPDVDLRRRRSGSSSGTFFDTAMKTAAPSWSDVSWLRQCWDGPLVLKGILTPEDARRAVDLGADAIVVSNHGGRQLDGAVSTARALP